MQNSNPKPDMTMKLIDQFFRNVQKRIEDEKDRATKAKMARERADARLKEKLSAALKTLEVIALEALKSDSEFSRFMLEKRIGDDYNSNKSRIIITNFEPLNVPADHRTEKKGFYIYITLENTKKYVEPKSLTEVKILGVSCGEWFWFGGRRHVHTELPLRLDLLHFIEGIDDLATFVETCTRSNTY